jgi:hydrogenase maturation protease
MATSPSVLVLGLGNVLWADDGFGVRAVEGLRKRCRFGDLVTLMDGGTQGFGLLRPLRTAEVLVVFCARHTSLHQGRFDEVFALAEALAEAPAHWLLIGVQPVTVGGFGAGLTPAVRRQLEPAVGMALDYLARFDVTPLRPREAGRPR